MPKNGELLRVRGLLKNLRSIVLRQTKGQSTWLRWKDFTTMERPWRVNHKSHDSIISWLKQEMNEDEFSLPDCGVLSAVTYRKLQESNLNVAYTGIDIAPQIIDDCRRRFRDVDWRVMDVQQLELPTASYDVVVVRHVLEHLPYYDGAIQEARRVCKRFAVFCLFFPLAKEDALAQKTKADGTYHYNTYGREGFLQLLRKEFTTVTEKMVEDPQRDNQLFICQV